jgi:hypothetical protein
MEYGRFLFVFYFCFSFAGIVVVGPFVLFPLAIVLSVMNLLDENGR